MPLASLPQESATAPRPAPPKLKESRGFVKRADRMARGVITFGGIAIIIAVFLILVLILAESIPIWRGATGGRTVTLELPTAASDPVLFAMTDPYGEVVIVLRGSGRFQKIDRKSRRVVETVDVPGISGGRIASASRVAGRDLIALGLTDGRLLLTDARIRVEFAQTGRSIHFAARTAGEAQVLPPGTPVTHVAAHPGEEGTSALAASGDRLAFLWLPAESDEAESPGAAPPVPTVVDLTERLAGDSVLAVAISETGTDAMVGTRRGELLPITIEGAAVLADDSFAADASDPSPVTALAYLLGGQSLVVGDAKGRVSSYFRVRSEENPQARPYRRIHVFDPMPAAVTAIGISVRNKGFVTADAAGDLWLRHNTSEQTLLKFRGDGDPIVAVTSTPQGDGLFAVGARGRISTYRASNPHPETTLKTLFGKVWYEGYDRPEYSWQSTGGTDDFEPKLSLTPLIYGTLKATFYALLFAIPTAVAAGLYASTFAHPAVRRTVKPVVEIMAALPSVVIGFLAGLWLAPTVERATVGTLLMLPMVPLLLILAAVGVRALPQPVRVRIRPMGEMAILIAVVAAGVYLAYALGPLVERTGFGGDFKAWLFESLQERYDPRNSLIIGFAMGFAVIPIIFTISEDAFSNVPAHLSAASLALGASRWQTAMRVILPTASPGVFSAIMIGFGRAVGETMIVLMATGNTPIMDWSIFNGMRTLSANIAVEIPEAPFGGTLYRVLFFAAAILFVMTFAVNTAAEIVRQRLRRKYEAI
ncbi:MAG TPA: ABC transporter permease subunit [Thermoanaerobaculia bacterium]